MPVTDIHPLILGTMRFADKGLNASQVSELLLASQSLGVNGLHVSSEYTSFALLSNAMQKMSASERHQWRLVAKIAGPHFDAEHFSAQDLQQRIDAVLTQLNVEQLAIAQWMWRLNPLDDDIRIARMTQQAEEIREIFQALVKSGKVAEFGCFPYSDQFMQRAFELDLVSSHINYLNPWELPLSTGGFAAETKLHDVPTAIAMRPLGAGKSAATSAAVVQQINDSMQVEQVAMTELCLGMAFSHPAVRAVVVSCSRIEQVQSLTEQLLAVKKSAALFNDYVVATEVLRQDL